MIQQLSVQLHAAFETHKPVYSCSCTKAYMVINLDSKLSQQPNGTCRQTRQMQQGRARGATATARLEPAQLSKPLGKHLVT